jgi:hypothetical protein
VESDGTNSGDRASPKRPVLNLKKPRSGDNACLLHVQLLMRASLALFWTTERDPSRIALLTGAVTDEKISVGRRLIPRTHCGDTLERTAIKVVSSCSKQNAII